LLSDNIKASVDCALKIQKLEGWTPWSPLTEFESWDQLTVEDELTIYPNIGQAFSDKDRDF